MFEYRIREVDQETKAQLIREHGYTESVVAVDRLDQQTNEWDFVNFAPDHTTAQQFIAQTNDPTAHAAFFSGRRQRGSFVGSNAEAQAHAQAQLSAAIAEDASTISEQEFRQRARRSKALEELMVKTFTTDRAAPGTGYQFLYLDWEEFEKLHGEYQDAMKQGASVAKHFEFQPLSAYFHKIVQTNPDGSHRRTLRLPFQNEVGMLHDRQGGFKYVILKDKGPGDLGEKYFQVKAQLDDSNTTSKTEE